MESDPYNPAIDEEMPSHWPKADQNDEGELKDPVKQVFHAISSIKSIPGLQAKDFEMTGGNLHLNLVRYEPVNNLRLVPFFDQYTSAVLSQSVYFGSFDSDNTLLAKALLPLTSQDAANLLSMFDIAQNINEGEDSTLMPASDDLIKSRLTAYFSYIAIHQLTTPSETWIFPKSLWPLNGKFSGWAIYKNDKIARIVVPGSANEVPEFVQDMENQGNKVARIQLEIRDKEPYLIEGSNPPQPLPKYVSVALSENIPFEATVNPASIDKAHRSRDVVFSVNFRLQGIEIHGTTPLKNLVISKADINSTPDAESEYSPLWVYSKPQTNGHQTSPLVLPTDPLYGEGALFPRTYREAGVAVGDRGYASYAAPTASSIQEQRIPIFVAGFYEPGVIPTGGRIILVNQEVTSLIRSSMNQPETHLTNGINVRFDSLDQANEVKALLKQAFDESGISPYWNIETFREYEFTKDILKQLQSEKNLFTLLAGLIILVACSNIVSMLIILVNDKKMEIGILRSMGASSLSIAFIFGTCGMIMGVMGSLLGIAAAIVTLNNLPLLVGLISRMQGYEMFNPIYFGDNLPTELSFEALGFVVIATTLLSLIAGLVPAVKASLIRPSAILRSE